MSISYVSSAVQDFSLRQEQELKFLPRNPADIFLGQAVINFGETKYGNVLPFLEKNADDLFLNLRVFLVFGKFLGLIPISGLFQRDGEELQYSKYSLSAIFSALIAAALSTSAVMGIVGLGSGGVDKADDYAWAPAMFTFYATGTYLYAYFYQHSLELVHLIQRWNSLHLHYTKPDRSLFRDANLIAGLLMTSAILENVMGHLRLFPVVPKSELRETTLIKESANNTAWEVYYLRSHGQWANFVPYNIVMAVFVFISNKLALYVWNYSDVLIAILSRAMYFKFKALYQRAETMLFTGNNHSDPLKWRQVARDHENLCNVMYDLNRFLSPLIFMSYGNNVYRICLQLNLSLTPKANNSTLASVYALWSFLHLIVRVYVVSLSAARISDWAHKIGDLFRRCPNEAYITEVERTERFLCGNTIGLSGLGCFIITKPLILQIVGVVFTFEIVLLQASQTSLQ